MKERSCSRIPEAFPFSKCDASRFRLRRGDSNWAPHKTKGAISRPPGNQREAYFAAASFNHHGVDIICCLVRSCMTTGYGACIRVAESRRDFDLGRGGTHPYRAAIYAASN